jgi:DNA-binding FrmR family transcriptional regulator
MDQTHTHLSHPRISIRLKRAKGHLASVITMIEEGRPCTEIAQQLQAVEKAITNAKRELIFDHIDHCLDEADDSNSAPGPSAAFKDIARYL